MAIGPDLRIGDSDREAAAALLREHYAAGRLTFEEFNQRLDAAFAATTQSQLSQVTRDLPHVGMPSAARPLAAGGQRRERAREHHGSAPRSGLRMLPSVIALLAVLLLMTGPHLGLFWPSRLVIFVAIFAAARALMRRLFRGARGPRGGSPRSRNGGYGDGSSSRRGPWH
ncbi:MAG: DUF1707 domain-containing protein [Streptosporangiaceae bacterium]